jgi:ribosomal protein S18 acetylase RimI-like enzyme
VQTIASVDDTATWREVTAQGAAIWSAAGRHATEPGRTVALAAVPSTDWNVIFCFGGDLPGPLYRTVEDMASSRVPIVLLVGGEALGWVQVLADAGLVCVGVAPFMRLPAGDVATGVRDPAVRRLRPDDMSVARRLVAEAYASRPPMGDAALPDAAFHSPAWDLWGLEIDGTLVSVVTTSAVGSASTVWSMSTPPDRQRRGYGDRLLRAVLSNVVEAGSEEILLYSSPSGERLYRSVGFRVVEYWQQWSRPRWILGRT